MRAVAAGEITYVHADHLGQPQKLTDTTATLLWDRVALPFGATRSEAGLGETSLRFPGQWADAESGLHYNYFRDYDPSLGRYIQSDPIGLAGGLNTYAYVHGNPLRWTDPTGERVANPVLVGVAVTLGTVAYKLRCKDLNEFDSGDYADIALAGLGGWGAAAGLRYAPGAAALLRHLLGGTRSGGGADAGSGALGGPGPSSSPLGHLLNGSKFEKFLTSKGRALQFLNSGSARAAFDQMRRELGVLQRQVTTHANGTQTFRAGNQTFSLRSDTFGGHTISVKTDFNIQQIVIRFRQ